VNGECTFHFPARSRYLGQSISVGGQKFEQNSFYLYLFSSRSCYKGRQRSAQNLLHRAVLNLQFIFMILVFDRQGETFDLENGHYQKNIIIILLQSLYLYLY